MRCLQKKENRKKKLRETYCIIGDFMVKHITDPEISKND